MRYLLKGGLILGETPADILIEDGRITKIGDVRADGAEVIDVGGRFVLPALADPHVHAREPGFEHKETLETVSWAAVAGGYAHVGVMPNTSPPIDSPEMVRALKARSENLPVGIHVVGAITKGREGRELTEMGLMREAGAFAFSDDGSWVSDPSVMLNALIYASHMGVPLITHAEVPELARGFANYDAVGIKYGMRFRSPLAEELAIYRDARMASLVGAHLHVAHISTPDGLEVALSFRERGARITTEITPHHLLFSTDRIPFYDPTFRVNPPIRSEADRRAMVDAFRKGLIDFVATDHAPHAYYEKEAPLTDASPGVEGLETAFSALYTHLVLTGEMSLRDLLVRMSARPADFLGVAVSLSEGSEANLFVFDQDAEWKVREEDLRSASKNNPFLGKVLRGRVLMTFAKGSLAYRR
ncbi:MAG: dihydroorotase [Thermotogae bacterium]|nr:dihydroorotase [Thermotogota bacterium]